jgi:sulfate/thiosulfate transport system permease protein
MVASSAPQVSAASVARIEARRRDILPGRLATLGITSVWLGSIVILPLLGLLLLAATSEPADILAAVTDRRIRAAFALSLGASALAALAALPVGMVIAWTLVRVKFPGRAFVDALIDIPFALPTAVSGIALAWLYSPSGWFGSWLVPAGFQIAYSRPGIFMALFFVGMPFVVRTTQPVIEALDRSREEAAWTLGASPVQTFFRVILPVLRPALLTGFALAFARGVGEYGSVIFIAGNMPLRTEIAPVLIVNRLEEFDYAGAAVLALALLMVSFGALWVLNSVGRKMPGGSHVA